MAGYNTGLQKIGKVWEERPLRDEECLETAVERGVLFATASY